MAKDPLDIAYDQLVDVFNTIKNAAVYESNKRPVSDPERKEPEMSDIDKGMIDMQRAKFDKELIQKIDKTLKEASESSERLGKKVFWLNVVVAFLTGAIAFSAIVSAFK